MYPSDYYSLLLFNMGTNDMSGEIWSTFTNDYMTLVAKNMGAQVVFSLILLVNERGLRWTRQIQLVND